MLKSLNFGEPIWGETPIMAPPIFVKFSLFLTSTHSENLIHITPTVHKFKNLKNPIDGNLSNLAPPMSVAQ